MRLAARILASFREICQASNESHQARFATTSVSQGVNSWFNYDYSLPRREPIFYLISSCRCCLAIVTGSQILRK
jgi:hypothetical protein